MLVEDEQTTRDLLQAVLVSAGFDVVCALTVLDVREAVQTMRFDVVLLDLRLPDGNALELISEIRSGTSAGIVVATSSRNQGDRLAGLENGADDFLEKPLHPRELVARIRNLVARMREARSVEPAGRVHRFEGWSVDLLARRVLFSDGREVNLTDGEFRMLESLIRHEGQPVHRDRLVAVLSGGDATGRAVDKVAYRLRLKLHAMLGRSAPLIETVHGVGYRFVAQRL